VAARIQVNLPSQITSSLRNSHQRIMARWTRSLSAGAFILRYKLPTNLAPGSYRLTVEARTDGSRQAYTLPVTIANGKPPVVEGDEVVVVGDSSGRSKLSLKLSAKAKVVVSPDGHVFDITGASPGVAVVVVDVDAHGVKLV